jgi:hypothetical protein
MSTTRSFCAPMVERAGIDFGPASLPDDVLRHRARSAPPEVRAVIDRQRASRGLPPLWARSTQRTSRAQTAARVRQLSAYVACVRGDLAVRTVTAAARRARSGT